VGANKEDCRAITVRLVHSLTQSLIKSRANTDFSLKNLTFGPFLGATAPIFANWRASVTLSARVGPRARQQANMALRRAQEWAKGDQNLDFGHNSGPNSHNSGCAGATRAHSVTAPANWAVVGPEFWSKIADFGIFVFKNRRWLLFFGHLAATYLTPHTLVSLATRASRTACWLAGSLMRRRA